jgi:hypothetical protein
MKAAVVRLFIFLLNHIFILVRFEIHKLNILY